MGKRVAPISLEQRMDALRADRGTAVEFDEISSLVGSMVQGTTHGDDVQVVASELKEMLQFISNAKSEMFAMQPKSLSNRDIPSAADQLDAIILATEDAAGSIMEAADLVSDVANELEPELAERLMKATTQIFEASSFQDLTGQRITKVMRTLAHLEERLNALADVIGDDYVAPPEEENIERTEEGMVVHEEDLLHGPQLEGQGNSQEDIDALLASFD